MISGAEIMVKCLEQENVEILFGYPGAAICPFYDALMDSQIEHILVRQEQNSVHAASGYARSVCKPGVCVATSGPGATNLITGIATAYMDSIPIIAITGQVRSDLIGRDVFQEADITGACEPFVKHSYLVKKTEDLPRIFKEAFYIATTGRPGPVLIDVPIDIQTNKIEEFIYPEKAEITGYKPRTEGHAKQIEKALELIKKSSRPIICAGGGVLTSGAKLKLVEFATKTGIPVVSTMMGIGVMPSENNLYLGMLGSHGKAVANKAIHEADVILICGARVGDRAVAAPDQLSANAEIIHIDIDPAEIGKNVDVTVPIVGDMAVVIQKMLDSVGDYSVPEAWADTTNCWKQTLLREAPTFEGCVEPRSFISKMSEMMPNKSILVADVGQNQIWCANNFRIKEGRFLTTGGMGTMGYSVPAAMGAKFARKDRVVVAVCGDGSFQMSMNELGTIAQNHLNVKIVIMRNDKLGMVRELQKNHYNSRYTATNLDSEAPDFMKIADAYNIESAYATTNEEAEMYAKKMIESDKAFVLVCRVSPDAPSV